MLERVKGDPECDLESRLGEQGVDNAWEVAPSLVTLGCGRGELAKGKHRGLFTTGEDMLRGATPSQLAFEKTSKMRFWMRQNLIFDAFRLPW
ncbi:MAG TPA: hypothetical protein VJ183_14010 [Chloroflexia bacterium]|nr:hypothetical protein [Chloroflexia bacterium]